MKNLILVFLLFMAGAMGHPSFSQKPSAKNVVIIYSDDQSYNTIAALGNPHIKTPNLDKLAASGLAFTQAHVMGGHQGAVCIPSRIMMLTGRYVNRLPGDGNVVPDSIVSMPEVLRKAGYVTFHAGKWHSDKASHTRMFSQADRIFWGGMHFPGAGGQEHPTVSLHDPTGAYPKSLSWKSDTFSSQLYTDAAIRFLETRKDESAPFFCYLALTSPHDPRTPPDAYRAMYDPQQIPLPPNFLPEHPFNNGDLKVRDEMLLPHPRTPEAVKQEIALYYGMVSELDAQVGRLLATLDKLGLRDNTLVIFAGDNGLAVGQHGLLGKQNLYEHSIRVPMIMSGPGIAPGKQTASFTYLSDITPTVLSYLGLQPPPTVEARSLMQLVKTPSKSLRNQLYNVYGHWSRSIKTTDGYKLIVYNVNGVSITQLFNLKKDPWEMENLAGSAEHQKKLKKMRDLLKAEMKATHDDLNIDLPDWGRKPGQKGAGS